MREFDGGGARPAWRHGVRLRQRGCFVGLDLVHALHLKTEGAALSARLSAKGLLRFRDLLVETSTRGSAGVSFDAGVQMDVTVGDEKFDRYYRKIRLGLRLMSHGARAQTASDWSGLTLDQLVTLRKRWMPGAEDGFRGPSPTSYKPFCRSALKASHAAEFVGIHRMVGIQGSKPSLEGGEKLCEAFEIYREWEPDAYLEFDYAVLLASGAIKGEEVELSACA